MRAGMQSDGCISCCCTANQVAPRVAEFRAKGRQDAPPNQNVSLSFIPLWDTWKQENHVTFYRQSLLCVVRLVRQ